MRCGATGTVTCLRLVTLRKASSYCISCCLPARESFPSPQLPTFRFDASTPNVQCFALLALVLGVITISATPAVSPLPEIGTPEIGEDLIALVKPSVTGEGRKIKIGNLVPQPADAGLTNDIWIAVRTDGKSGDGSQPNPFDGSTQPKFDAIMARIPENSVIHLGPGVFQTRIAPSNLWKPKSGWTIRGAGMYATTLQAAPANLARIHYDLQIIKSDSARSTDNVTIRDLTLDCNWPAFAVSADAGAGSYTLTDGCISSGSPVLSSASGNFSEADFTRSISATGIPRNTTILGIPNATITGGSTTLPQTTINVDSTASFASSGTFQIELSTGVLATITYTGKTSTSFAGCSGGMGIMMQGNRVFAKHQAIMSAKAAATATSVSVTVGGEKYSKVDGLAIWGGNNLVENVRCINNYGSFANNSESFVIFLLASLHGGTNNEVRNCRVELPQGNHGEPFAMASYDDNNLLTNSRIVGCYAKGRNTGDTNFGFTTGGANASGAGVEISGNTLIDCSGIYYCDTSAITDVRIIDNTLVRGRTGISLVARNSNAWRKRNVLISGNKIGVQNRDVHFPVGAFYCTYDDTSNLTVRGNNITYDNGGEAKTTPAFIPFNVDHVISGSIVNNTVDDGGGVIGQLYSHASAVRVHGNKTFSGKDLLWVVPDRAGAPKFYDGHQGSD